jgi:hypothetical protein
MDPNFQFLDALDVFARKLRCESRSSLRFRRSTGKISPLGIASAETLITIADRFFADSALEGTGFEPSVPRQEKWSMPSSSDQTRGGRTLTLGGGAESSLEGRDIELSVSPKDIRTSPYDLCANRSDRQQSREGDRWFESTSLQR